MLEMPLCWAWLIKTVSRQMGGGKGKKGSAVQSSSQTSLGAARKMMHAGLQGGLAGDYYIKERRRREEHESRKKSKNLKSRDPRIG